MRTRKWERGTRNGGGESGPRSHFRVPRLEHRGLIPGVHRGRRGIPKVAIRAGRRAAAPRRAREEALLHQERLVHLLERARVLAHGGGDRLDADGAALELLDDGAQDARVHVVQPELVYVEALQGFERDRGRDLAAGAHLGVVAHALQEPVRDPRRAAAAPRDLGDARGVRLDAENSRRPGDDLGEIVGRIVGEPLDQAEARAHRRRGQAEAQRVVQGLLALLRGVDRDLQRFLHLRLADELVEPRRAQRRVADALLGEHLGGGDLGAHDRYVGLARQRTGRDSASIWWRVWQV